MALELQKRLVTLVQDLLSADLSVTPDWLVRPGRLECGSDWSRVSQIYTALTGKVLPDVMRTVERRTVDAVIVQRNRAPFILEVDEKQHFNEYRALTLRHYSGVPTAFNLVSWTSASLAKRTLEGGGFARPMEPLFPALMADTASGPFAMHFAIFFLRLTALPRHCALLIAHFEVADWIFEINAVDCLRKLLRNKLGDEWCG